MCENKHTQTDRENACIHMHTHTHKHTHTPQHVKLRSLYFTSEVHVHSLPIDWYSLSVRPVPTWLLTFSTGTWGPRGWGWGCHLTRCFVAAVYFWRDSLTRWSARSVPLSRPERQMRPFLPSHKGHLCAPLRKGVNSSETSKTKVKRQRTKEWKKGGEKENENERKQG